MNPKSFDFKHKVTKKALCVDDWSTPPWVKGMLKLPSHVGYHTSDSQKIVQPNRYWHEHELPNHAIFFKPAMALGWVKEVHKQAREAGFELDLRVGNALVHMYAKCGSMHDARLVFDRMEERDVITWTLIIGGLAECGFEGDAYDLFIRMQQEGFKPDTYTYVSILNAFSNAGALEWVKEVHKQAREAGFELDLRVGNALVHMYAKCGSVHDVRLVFDRMEERDVITWTLMIGGLAERGFGGDAYDLFIRMQQEGFKPNEVTYLSILNPCASAGALEWVKEVHKHAREAGLELDLRVGSALVHMYAKCGSMDDARLVFDRMEDGT